MLRNSWLALLTVVTSAPAAGIISYTGVPTPGLPGYGTFTVTVSNANGLLIQGFDFASKAEYGFFGSMNQVNPAGLPTIYQDNNPHFSSIGAEVLQDSQFLFLSTSVTLPPGFASESATKLRAVFAAAAPIGTSVPFVQLVIPPFGTVQAVGQYQPICGACVVDGNLSFAVSNPFPEPPTIALLGLTAVAGVGFLRHRRRDSVSVRCSSPRC